MSDALHGRARSALAIAAAAAAAVDGHREARLPEQASTASLAADPKRAGAPLPEEPVADLAARVYDLGALRCDCGGKLVFVALVTDAAAVGELLTVLKLPTTTLVLAKARSPTLLDIDPVPAYALD